MSVPANHQFSGNDLDRGRRELLPGAKYHDMLLDVGAGRGRDDHDVVLAVAAVTRRVYESADQPGAVDGVAGEPSSLVVASAQTMHATQT